MWQEQLFGGFFGAFGRVLDTLRSKLSVPSGTTMADYLHAVCNIIFLEIFNFGSVGFGTAVKVFSICTIAE